MLGLLNLITAAGVADTVRTAAESLKTDAVGMIDSIGPIGLAVTASFVVWSLARSFFRTLGTR